MSPDELQRYYAEWEALVSVPPPTPVTAGDILIAITKTSTCVDRNERVTNMNHTYFQTDEDTIVIIETGVVYTNWHQQGGNILITSSPAKNGHVTDISYVACNAAGRSAFWAYLQSRCVNKSQWLDEDEYPSYLGERIISKLKTNEGKQE